MKDMFGYFIPEKVFQINSYTLYANPSFGDYQFMLMVTGQDQSWSYLYEYKYQDRKLSSIEGSDYYGLTDFFDVLASVFNEVVTPDDASKWLQQRVGENGITYDENGRIVLKPRKMPHLKNCKNLKDKILLDLEQLGVAHAVVYAMLYTRAQRKTIGAYKIAGVLSEKDIKKLPQLDYFLTDGTCTLGA